METEVTTISAQVTLNDGAGASPIILKACITNPIFRHSARERHPMSQSTVHTIQISSIFESFICALAYGIYITTFGHCLRWLFYNDGGRIRLERGNAPMLIVSIVIFLLETTELATSFRGALAAQNLNPLIYNILNTTNNAIEYTLYQIVDAVLIYRCWVVYGRSYKIICLPILFWISSVALTTYAIYLYAVTLTLEAADQETLYKVSILVAKIWDGFFSCNIATNIYATTAIVYRIVQVTKNSVLGSGRLHRTWRIIAESGVLYTTATIINLIGASLVSRSPAYEPYVLFQATVDPININMAGIAFNLILIRVGQQRQQGTVDYDKSSDPQLANDKSRPILSVIRFHNAEGTSSTSTQNTSALHSNMDYQHV
ncbi:hypothetical protein AX15_006722 [Amanita polypyramis BW_CC]|nr:hypothetical protein AX15_006722 [Amanita polypyramis BW_CC]